jgi:hypothetical protein
LQDLDRNEQKQGPSHFTPVKNPPLPNIQRLDGTKTESVCDNEEKVLSPGRESNPDFLAVQPVAKFTTVIQLPGSKAIH